MADKRADQLKEITERLEQGVKDIFTSEMYTKYLLTMSKFHNYSFNNTLLIAMQRPDATLVAGYTLYNKDFTVMDGGIIEVDGYRPVQEVMEEVLAEHGHSVSECGVISAEYLQEQSYRAETQRAEAMKEKLAAEKPAPEASISFYVAECAEFPVMGEFHDNLTLEQALEVYDKIPAERMNGIKSIGFSLEDGSIYSGMFDLMVGGEVQAEVVNHIQHYRESPLVQKAISDMKTLLEKRQASKELEERPNIRQSVREALKNRKKAQEQQPNQEQVKPKKAKKKGEMEL